VCEVDGFAGGDCEGLPEPEMLSVGIPAHGWPEGWHWCPCGCTQMVYEQDRGPTHAVPGDERGRRAAWVLEGAR